MKLFLQNSWKYLISIIIGIVIGLIINIPSCNTQETQHIIEYVEKHDTISVEKERIVEKTKIKYVNTIDTFYIYNNDTIYLQEFPIEHKEYKDTIKTDSTSTEIKINYSGFNANIDDIWLRHNYFEKHETVIKTKKVGFVWFAGISLGYDACLDVNNKTFSHGPGVALSAGIGIGGTIK